MNTKYNIFIAIAAMLALLFSAGQVQAQLNNDDLDELDEQSNNEGWTFDTGENSATHRSLDNLCGVSVPEDWEDGV